VNVIGFAVNEFHYVDMRLDKINVTELVFWHEVRIVLFILLVHVNCCKFRNSAE
jgi:hypothetical protein